MCYITPCSVSGHTPHLPGLHRRRPGAQSCPATPPHLRGFTRSVIPITGDVSAHPAPCGASPQFVLLQIVTRLHTPRLRGFTLSQRLEGRPALRTPRACGASPFSLSMRFSVFAQTPRLRGFTYTSLGDLLWTKAHPVPAGLHRRRPSAQCPCLGTPRACGASPRPTVSIRCTTSQTPHQRDFTSL